MGFDIPMPPSLTGRASRSLSSSEHGGRPVRAGIKCWWIASSNGCSRVEMSGMVRDK